MKANQWPEASPGPSAVRRGIIRKTLVLCPNVSALGTADHAYHSTQRSKLQMNPTPFTTVPLRFAGASNVPNRHDPLGARRRSPQNKGLPSFDDTVYDEQQAGGAYKAARMSST